MIRTYIKQKIKNYPAIEKKLINLLKWRRNTKEYLYSLRFGFLAKYFPQRHCLLMTRPGGIKETPFFISLKTPKYFNEKLLWLKYYIYNKSPLVAKCNDKYLVREYVKECGCEYILNELYGVWQSIDEVPWNNLPEEYVMKLTNGNSYHIFKFKEEKIDISKYREILLKPAKNRNTIYRKSGDLFALKSTQRIVCEKLLKNSSSNNGLDDWKFYCFNGEPRYLLYAYDRIVADGTKEASQKLVFMTVDFENSSDFFKGSKNNNPRIPSCYEEMLECARKLSKDFPFVRVDFFVSEGKPIFGELTFTPYGGYLKYHLHNKEGLTMMGNFLCLDNIDKYTKLKKGYIGL